MGRGHGRHSEPGGPEFRLGRPLWYPAAKLPTTWAMGSPAHRPPLVWAGLLGLSLAGCFGPRPCQRPALPEEALAAYGRAQDGLRSGGAAGREQARREAERALELAPDWIAPSRLLDNSLERELLLPERLAVYERKLAQREADGGVLYLRGRLRGARGIEDFDRALSLDPHLAWARHGRAWIRAGRGDLKGAVADELRAIECARSPFERVEFTRTAVQRLTLLDEPETARRVLERGLSFEDLQEAQRVELAVQLAGLELEAEEDRVVRRGIERALGLVRTAECAPAEVVSLTSALARHGPAVRQELELALFERGGTTLEHGRRVLDERSGALAAYPGTSNPETVTELRAWSQGRVSSVLEAWLERLPRRVLTSDGQPRDERLRELVQRGLAMADPVKATREQLASFAEALVAAGWFQEGRAFAHWLAEREPELATDLEHRVLAGTTAIEAFRRLALSIDKGESYGLWLDDPTAPPGSEVQTGVPQDIGALDDFLRALAPAWSRSERVLGRGSEVESMREELAASPRISYGPFASIVHPGPRYSTLDEERGLGTRGEEVPGLASRLEKLRRFAVLGRAAFNGIDATLRRILWVEERAGAHLGVPWRGTVVWCQGEDLGSRYERRGANIAGAALHEGYWIDVEAVRASWRGVDALRRSFEEGEEERIQKALDVRGPQVSDRFERRSTHAPLGEDKRLWLAVMAERGEREGGGRLGPISFDEMLAVTALHEEAHLCDRTRFYPPGRHLWAIFRLFARNGFNPAALAGRMEYRAQLVALAESPEPRLPLAEIVSDGPSEGITAHGGAYEELLEDFLRELDRQLEDHADAFAGIDREHRLVHQLHHLSAEEVRRVAMSLARREFGRSW